MQGGKGGSETANVQIPAYLEGAIQDNLGRASTASQIGYTPYYGPDVAAMTPMQNASLANTNQAADAFGMASADLSQGMPQAQNYDGLSAYSSGGLYDHAKDQLQQRNPSQYNAIESMFGGSGSTYGGGGFGSAVGGGSGGDGSNGYGVGDFAGDAATLAGGAYLANQLGLGNAIGRGVGQLGSKVGGALGLTGGASSSIPAGFTTASQNLAVQPVQTQLLSQGGNAASSGLLSGGFGTGGATAAQTLAGIGAIAPIVALGAFGGVPSGKETVRREKAARESRILAPLLAQLEANDPTPDGMTRMEYNLMKNPNKYATKSLTDDDLQEQYFLGGY
jgi:hypothetical protein